MGHFTHGPLARVVLLSLLLGCDSSDRDEEAPTCLTIAHTGRSAGFGIEKLDLLFVVDTSPSMAQEQAALARELPELMRRLTTGEIPGSDDNYSPRRELHVGVISADLGVDGSSAAIAGCTEDGDAARLQQRSGGAACAENYPAFLSYFAPDRPTHPSITQPSPAAREQLAQDVGCMAQLGSTGCAVSQPLEAALRALGPGGAHADFLRNGPVDFAELQIVLISDRDDCSVNDPALFEEAAQVAPDAIDAVCAQRRELLHDLNRFADGLRALKPGLEAFVWFSAITGIPADLQIPADADPRSNYFLDTAQREAHFAEVLADPRMQPKRRQDGTLEPVCENQRASATPARRLVQLAQRFGTQADVRSICDADWSRAVRPIQSQVHDRLNPTLECLRRFERTPDGLAPCRVRWELPLPAAAPRASPTHCSDLPFLTPVAGQPISPEGRELCEVHQLLYRGANDPPELEPGGGWFYDEFMGSNQRCVCSRPEGCSRILFVPDNPPEGVTVTLQCQETSCVTPGCDPSECRVPG